MKKLRDIIDCIKCSEEGHSSTEECPVCKGTGVNHISAEKTFENSFINKELQEYLLSNPEQRYVLNLDLSSKTINGVNPYPSQGEIVELERVSIEEDYKGQFSEHAFEIPMAGALFIGIESGKEIYLYGKDFYKNLSEIE